MECHYAILGVELNADDGAIKKAYRKAALKYHPDKNPNCLEEATEKFRLVQAAYDVLSDPQERAWYDRHREEILHRKKYENYKENSFDLWEYFSPSAYKGFGDDANGFYAVYRDVFKKIDVEDQPFKDEGSAGDEWMPCFGSSESDYDDVVHEFYSSWQSYCTHLSYVWESQYDVKEAPNRRVARLVEKENKKVRDKHKKKRNELVRELVSFVRKRDPRVKAHKAELERIATEQAVKAEERRMSEMRAKAEEAALYDQENFEELAKHNERVSQLENMMRDEFGFSSDEDSDNSDQNSEEEQEYSDDMFCVACNKMFKSVMGMRNHQKSKKHKENMNRLKQEMQEEASVDDITEDPNREEIEDEVDDRKLTKKQKKQKRQQQKLLSNMMESEPLKTKDFEERIDPVQKSDEVPKLETEFDGDIAENEKSIADDIGNTSDCNADNETSVISDEKPQIKKKRQKKKGKAMPQVATDSNSESLGCGKCNQVFPSRNKLFQHLKKTGHSLLINEDKSNKRKNTKSLR
uniref:DnaJ homolog subfamily C member 21 n=1 Tax=Botryllus schlosseri TaxID=30301 RepID=V9M0J8_BOTSH|nr:HSP40-like protein [Botryllus schlosseri]